jgi:hypothetical protein
MHRAGCSIRLLLAFAISAASHFPFSTRGGEQIERGGFRTGQLLPAEVQTVQLAEDGVTVTGTLVSADTGAPIEGAVSSS